MIRDFTVYRDNEACLEKQAGLSWTESFNCPTRGSERSCKLKQLGFQQHARCCHQVSLTTETLIGNCMVSHNGRFVTISSDQGDILVLRMLKIVQVNWHTVHRNLRRFRQTMCSHEVRYLLQDLVEMIAMLAIVYQLNWCDIEGG